jgi:hypothetical protein
LAAGRTVGRGGHGLLGGPAGGVDLAGPRPGVVVVETSSVAAGRRSRSRSPRQQRVLPASVIRALPRGRALVWTTGVKVAMVATLPW